MHAPGEIAHRRPVTFEGASSNRIAGDQFVPDEDPVGSVLLVHGGGQTRHSWRGTAADLAARGWIAITIDQRGHGDSEWPEAGGYGTDDFAADMLEVARQVTGLTGFRPAVIGASLGGLAGLLAAGRTEADPHISALVLVDVTPRMKTDGVRRVVGFMREHAVEGFASLEEASDAIAAYLPHRPRPRDLSGLSKNLRLDPDGRYRWHWDPRFIDGRLDAAMHAAELEADAGAAARALRIPTLLVRGRESELVGEEEADAFLRMVPHARSADVSGARHMVAGDRNDVFTSAVVDFLEELKTR